mmetsp:Transcript_91671/g.200971  ORF Transcript_91671/g.200971 Transcript_91671/m.200971 type:complete len:206 (+) Transcript_91671:1520-2137(+)
MRQWPHEYPARVVLSYGPSSCAPRPSGTSLCACLGSTRKGQILRRQPGCRGLSLQFRPGPHACSRPRNSRVHGPSCPGSPSANTKLEVLENRDPASLCSSLASVSLTAGSSPNTAGRRLRPGRRRPARPPSLPASPAPGSVAAGHPRWLRPETPRRYHYHYHYHCHHRGCCCRGPPREEMHSAAAIATVLLVGTSVCDRGYEASW